ncbi:phosphatase PAP2 family protein [Fictibacillus phosphorivorans]|uniref:phosphatase PAP2 family protein n=1 Tax=Fictibacillus phosphorivorans TaxID=1221500 RepID=UPI0012935237|nr:phosphatase PAP2 family protein [Fictibacillus phosphorivorans]MQR94346.1 phosphatase PAP2 family protein [Fictibacillus phosphorivorans]
MKKSYLSMMLCITLFIIFAFYESIFVKSFDFSLREWMLSLRTESLNNIVLAFTHVGDAKVLAVLCLLGAIVLFIMKKWRNSLLLIGSILVSYGLNLLVKSLFQRERPQDFRLLEEDGYSFPSGNAMVGTTFYLFAAVLLYQRFQKRWILVVGVILPFLLGLSRVYVGVHYPSDILAGFALGIVTVIVLSKLTDKSAKQLESVNRNNTNTAV